MPSSYMIVFDEQQMFKITAGVLMIKTKSIGFIFVLADDHIWYSAFSSTLYSQNKHLQNLSHFTFLYVPTLPFLGQFSVKPVLMLT